MPRLLLLVAQFVLASLFKRVLLAAGLALGTFSLIDTLFNKYIDLAINGANDFSAGVWGLLALAGIPTCISLLLSATVARVIIQTTTLSLKKL